MQFIATIHKMPVAEIIAAQTSNETPRQVAKRLGVTYAAVKNTLASENWGYALLAASYWTKPMSEIRRAIDNKEYFK